MYQKSCIALGAMCLCILAGGLFFNLQADEQKNEVPVTGVEGPNVPDHEIKYEDNLSPDWKVNWDMARQLYRDNKHREALIQYELLLAEKDTIEEARWEYTTILLYLERWSKSEKELNRLLSNEPGNTKYLFALAQVYLKTGKYDMAAKMYSQLYEQSTGEPENADALEGLIEALEHQGNIEAVLPLLERLTAQRPGDKELQKKLVVFSLEAGAFDAAEKTLLQLEQTSPDDVFVLSGLAELYEQRGNMDKASSYWQRIISIDPANKNSHEKLYRYYLDQQNWLMSLKHAESQLKNQPNDVELLESAAELNLKTGRIDKSLEYYDYLLALKPGNTMILKKKKHVQRILAADLLALVENEGSQKLWQDLVIVTSDRPGVYREIAYLLRKKGKTDELIEVLALICQEDPEDIDTLAELKKILKQKGRSQDLAALLSNSNEEIEPENSPN